MKSISLSEAKRQLTALVDALGKTGEPVLITKHGRVVARLIAEQNSGFGWNELSVWVTQNKRKGITVEQMRGKNLL